MNSEDEQCSICLGQFQVPRMLPCSHCFCHQCLQQHITESHSIFSDSFLCPLCRRRHRPPTNRHFPFTLWANCYPINIFAKVKCQNHNSPSDGMCFCHDVHLCFRCLLQLHRHCCLCFNPTRKKELIAHFQETFNKAVLWQSRLTNLREKKEYEDAECDVHLVFIEETLLHLKTLKDAILIDLEKTKQQTLESDTLRLVSDDFGVIEHNLINNLKPQSFSEFHINKDFFTQSPGSLVKHKLLSDDNIVVGLAEEDKVFMINPQGKCLCEVVLLGRLVSIDVFGEDLIIVLLKLHSTNAVEGSCLQYLRYSDLRMFSVNSYSLERSYTQTVALSEEKIVALYHERHWVIDVLQIKDNNVVTGVKCGLSSELPAQIYPYDSQHIIYTNEIEIFRVNIQDKTEVRLLNENRTRRNSINQVFHLARNKSAIFFADVLNASIYKMSANGEIITLFLNEKMKKEKIFSFHLNPRGHILICFDLSDCYRYCLYKGEDFVGWNEEFSFIINF